MTFQTAADARSDAMNSHLAQNWWAVALRGAAAVLFGLAALFMPGPTMLSLVLLFAVYMLVDAVFALVSAVRAVRRHGRWPMFILQAIIDLASAALAFLWPGITVIAFVLLFAAWSVITGVFALVAAVKLRTDHGRFWLGLSGVLSIVFAALLAIAPLVGAVVLTWWIGAYAVILGLNLLVLAYRLRSHRGDELPSALAAGA